MSDHIPDCTPESIAAALKQQQIDRQQVAVETGWIFTSEGTLIDPVTVGVRLGNAMVAALYGPQGEWRG